ncbi:MAG TPA: hypothetical protein VGJ00_00785 [Rhabdochlamydiaceae bacterium]|jgi:hypothetical protein
MKTILLSLLLLCTLVCGKLLLPVHLGEAVSRGVVYFGTGSFLETLSFLTRLSWGLDSLLPQKVLSGNEYLLFSDLCSQGAKLAFGGPCDKCNWQRSWQQNQGLLTQVPVYSQEDKELLHFLQNRWLAKMAGISRIGLDWVYPCFGLDVQANPMSNHAYARLPSQHMNAVYKKRVEDWTRKFAKALPLILTRPFDIGGFLPEYCSFAQNQSPDTVVKKLGTKSIVDVTDFLTLDANARSEWEKDFSHSCFAEGLDVNEIICIERVREEGIGGVRILPLTGQSSDAAAKQHDFLLDCISMLGLVANRIELDRGGAQQDLICKTASSIKVPDREEFLCILDEFEAKCAQVIKPKKILLDGTLQALKGLISDLPEQKWQQVLDSPTKSVVTWLSMVKIKKQLQLLSENLDKPLFEIARQLEPVHADLTALLEVLTPFTFGDFPAICRDLLALPAPLEPLVSFGIHSAAMTSLSAIVKAVEKEAGSVHAIYGENSYYECAKALRKLAHSSVLADNATEQDLQRANLLLAQCNPALRVDLEHEEYRLEEIESMTRQCLNSRSGAPLTLALDCSLDFIASPKITKILNAFSKEILEGMLTVIVFRSANKFDLLGMDNYIGSPFFLIRNGKPAFDFLLTDPALQCDRLSFNWFCLAYRHIAPQLERYKKQIFANTRSLLDKVPKELEQKTGRYRIVPIVAEADPAFIDIKVAGPLQQFKAAALVLPLFFLESMKGKQPIFNRPSLGFYHPNVTMIFGEECTTIRLTLGLDPAQVDIFAKCFETINSLL